MTAVTDRRKDSARRRSSSALLAPARRCGRRTSQVGTKERPLWSKQGRVLAEPGGRWSVGQSSVVMAEPIDKSVLTRQRGGVAGVETHSRRLVWMNRSALSLVRGV